MDLNVESSPGELSQLIWDNRYRYRSQNGEVIDRTLDDTWRRVARVLASAETTNRNLWENRFYQTLKDFSFIPGGRILAGAGVDQKVTLFNCFVMGEIHDTAVSIIKNLRESASTLLQGGGIGCDFSTLLPRGMNYNSCGTVAHGPVYAMLMWDEMCATLSSTASSSINHRHGAMMATLRCDHPDITDFINAKKNNHHLHSLNSSVLITDEFMDAVKSDGQWPLIFPDALLAADKNSNEIIMREWSGEKNKIPCRILQKISARDLWDRIMRANYEAAEPGVLFIDRINRLNNLWYRETISCTNPCGEVPLPAYGACDLGSINLTRFVREPFTKQARLDAQGIYHVTMLATRMLDNIIDLSSYPLHEQKEQANGARRLGIGITGLADALIQLGLHYAEPKARKMAVNIMEIIRDSAYYASAELAHEKGSFPFFDKKQFLDGENIRRLPHDIRERIIETGIRNSHLTAIAPTGTISLLAGNISNGIEPLFDYHYKQNVHCGIGSGLGIGNGRGFGKGTGMGIGIGKGTGIGKWGVNDNEEGRHITLNNYSYQMWVDKMGWIKELPDYFVTAHELSPDAHLKMVSALQPYIDNAISKTVNVSENIPFHEFCSIYENAYHLGLKGCSIFRYNSITAAPLKRP